MLNKFRTEKCLSDLAMKIAEEFDKSNFGGVARVETRLE